MKYPKIYLYSISGVLICFVFTFCREVEKTKKNSISIVFSSWKEGGKIYDVSINQSDRWIGGKTLERRDNNFQWVFSEMLYNKNEDKKDGYISVSLPKDFWGGVLAVNVNCEVDISLESPDGSVWKKSVFPKDRIQIFRIVKPETKNYGTH